MSTIADLSLDSRKLIVGIDFGTTFSGVAWATTRRPDQLSIIESWPGPGARDGMSGVKVPTQIRYTTDGTVEWGFQIPPLTDKHEWFKLGLADGKKTGGDKTPEELTTDYLKALHSHLMYSLEQKLGLSILRTIPIEFCLTVPAIWTEVAKEKTSKAFKSATKSQSTINLVSEPEAAAIYALNGLDPHDLKSGESFVLCDAGGGTVDLISYTITELQPILKIKEAAAGTGGLCGSTFLNRRFGEFLTRKLEKEPGWDEELLSEAMERFDSVIKKQYSPSMANQDGYTILVPGIANNEALGIRRGRFTIKPVEMKSIFDPVIAKVIELVKEQIKATIKTIRAVLLVGGFGQNAYLKECLRGALGAKINVLQPPHAWTSVVRGAVMMGLARADASLASVSLESRKARSHHGVELHVTYVPSRHDDSKKYWDKKYNEYRVYEMQWFIKKGDPVLESKPFPISFHQDYLVADGNPKKVSINVSCDRDSEEAPVHKNKNTQKLVRLEGDLSNLTKTDLNSIITRCEDGKDYYRVKGAVEATYYSASTKYVLLCRGNRYDSVTAEYV